MRRSPSKLALSLIELPLNREVRPSGQSRLGHPIGGPSRSKPASEKKEQGLCCDHVSNGCDRNDYDRNPEQQKQSVSAACYAIDEQRKEQKNSAEATKQSAASLFAERCLPPGPQPPAQHHRKANLPTG